ncbi:MAG: hypothetical protein M1819_003907 [Sarea resinae]|nr:MAG: hypothetical protein M1819_003907 [Sarea resinae]
MSSTPASSLLATVSTSTFPPLYIHNPSPDHAHTHTILLLHGRDSTGPEFCSQLLASKTSSGLSVPEALPHWRLVFPTSKERWSTTFEELEDVWFDIASLTDVKRKSELQVEGLRESARYLSDVLRDEIERVESSKRMIIGGISMGMATGLWLLFYWGRVMGAQGGDRLGGFVGFSGWLPFWSKIMTMLDEGHYSPREATAEVSRFISSTIGSGKSAPSNTTHKAMPEDGLLLSFPPLFLGHGRDDIWVDVSLGQTVEDLFREKFGMEVHAKKYEGAESEGHWLKEPEELDDTVEFLRGIEEKS